MSKVARILDGNIASGSVEPGQMAGIYEPRHYLRDVADVARQGLAIGEVVVVTEMSTASGCGRHYEFEVSKSLDVLPSQSRGFRHCPIVGSKSTATRLTRGCDNFITGPGQQHLSSAIHLTEPRVHHTPSQKPDPAAGPGNSEAGRRIPGL
jgi:hypothetical protein